jgi:hypothetical protein
MSFSLQFSVYFGNLNFTKCPRNLQPRPAVVHDIGVTFEIFRRVVFIVPLISTRSFWRLIRCFNYFYFNPSPMIWSSAFLLKIDSHCVILNYLTQASLECRPGAGVMMLCKLTHESRVWMWNQFSILHYFSSHPSLVDL